MAHGDLAQAARRLAGHVLEVRRLAADHGAERDEAGVALRWPRRPRRRRGSSNAPGTHTTSTSSSPMPASAQQASAPVEEPGGDQLVVAADQDRHAPGAAEAGGEFRHGVSGRGGGRACRAWPRGSRGSRSLGSAMERHPLDDLEAVALETDQLPWDCWSSRGWTRGRGRGGSARRCRSCAGRARSRAARSPARCRRPASCSA